MPYESVLTLHKESTTTPIQNLSGKAQHHVLRAPGKKGQNLIEYAIILSLVAVIVVAVLWLLQPSIGNSYSSINSSVP
jgi:Flp pilus assembly pilin Flp